MGMAYGWTHAEIVVTVDGVEVAKMESRPSNVVVTWMAPNANVTWADKYGQVAPKQLEEMTNGD